MEAAIKTPEEIEVKRAELALSLKKKVYSFCFDTSEFGQVVGYLKEPDFFVKTQALDMSMRSLTQAGNIILEHALLREESDSRILHEDAEERYPEIKLGAIMEAQGLVKYFLNTLKKN